MLAMALSVASIDCGHDLYWLLSRHCADIRQAALMTPERTLLLLEAPCTFKDSKSAHW
jgi:hypothetical protein